MFQAHDTFQLVNCWVWQEEEESWTGGKLEGEEDPKEEDDYGERTQNQPCPGGLGRVDSNSVHAD